MKIVPDRLSVGHVTSDFWRSMKLHSSGRLDVAAQYLLIVLPLLALAISIGSEFRISQPAVVLPATSLLSGVLLAASGQLISLRARVADSVVLSGDVRVRSMFREALSGVLTAALTALVVTLLLIAVGSVPVGNGISDAERWAGIVLSGLIASSGVFLVLVFFASVRRLYAAYLEAFEGGLPLIKGGSLLKPEGGDGDEQEDRSQLDALGIPEVGQRRA